MVLNSLLLRGKQKMTRALIKSTPPDLSPSQAGIKRFSLMGIIVVVVLVGGIGGWMATAQLSGAVIASGQIVVESNAKAIQHATGGTVIDILVQDGSIVDVGDVLLRLDDTVPKASRDIYRSQLDEMLARQSRLIAEAAGLDTVIFEDELLFRQDDPAVMVLLERERQLFDVRANSIESQLAQLDERIDQIHKEISGLEAQSAAKTREGDLIARELEGVRDLFEQNLVSVGRLNALERQQVQLEGIYGQLVSEIARARGRIIEIELQAGLLKNEFRDNALNTLAETQVQIAELRQLLTAANDQLSRVEITSPQAGIVQGLAVHTIGGVVGVGEVLMQIIPTGDALVLDARVTQSDIDQVRPGALVRIQIQAGNQRSVPELDGIITRVSADLTRDPQTGLGYYEVRASLPDDVEEQLGDLKLLPGMAATAFIQTESRTALDYLMKPLYEQVTRTFRER